MNNRSLQTVAIGQHHSVNKEPVTRCKVADAILSPGIIWTLSNMNMDTDSEICSKPRGRFKRLIRTRECGMNTDHPSTAATDESTILLEPSARAISTMPIGHPIATDGANPDLCTSLSNDIERTLDGVRRFVMIDDRSTPSRKSFESAQPSRVTNDVKVKGGIEPPPNQLENLSKRHWS
jgi:hypothetical protein